jgi:hypothetical protein
MDVLHLMYNSECSTKRLFIKKLSLLIKIYIKKNLYTCLLIISALLLVSKIDEDVNVKKLLVLSEL